MENRTKYTLILGGVFIVSVCVLVFYSYKYNMAYTLLPVAGLLVSILFLSDLWLKNTRLSKLLWIVQRFVWGLLFIAIYTPLSNLQEKYVSYQLKNYGVNVKGKVLDGSGYADIEYTYNNIVYKQRVSNYYYTYKYHDYLNILCSSHDPEMFVITSVKPALDIKY